MNTALPEKEFSRPSRRVGMRRCQRPLSGEGPKAMQIRSAPYQQAMPLVFLVRAASQDAQLLRSWRKRQELSLKRRLASRDQDSGRPARRHWRSMSRAEMLQQALRPCLKQGPALTRRSISR